MGYDVDQFVVPVKDGLLCCICHDVLEDPVQATSCEHAYCKACIHAWLVHEHTCPECRTPLHSSHLRPLFRYMKNDLDQLQIRCSNSGCSTICTLEHLPLHQARECTYQSNSTQAQRCPTCAQYVASQDELQHHLDHECAFRPLQGSESRRECPHGCGLEIFSNEDLEHSCIAELRTAVELTRSELLCRLGEQREETELRLRTQRRHMEQRDQAIRQHLYELRRHMVRLQQDLAELKKERAFEEERKLTNQLAKLNRQCSNEAEGV